MTQKYVPRKSNYNTKRKKTRYRFKYGKEGAKAFMAALAVVIVAVIAIAIWRSNTIRTLSMDTFYPGITIDGMDLSGLSYEEAKEKLSLQLKEDLADVSIKITHNPADYGLTGEKKEWSYDYAGLIFKGNEEEVNALVEEILTPKLDQAYAQGRTGTSRERISQIRRIKNKGWEADSSISYDILTPLKSELEAIKQEVEVPATNASYRYQGSGFTYTESVNGWSLDTDALLKQVESAFAEDHHVNVKLTLASAPAQYTTEQLKQATSLISSFSTNYSTSAYNRKNNIQKALGAFDGKMVLPGEEISFNATTGERTKENGYLTAPAIGTDKGLVDDYGGGVCQASTTLYMAAKKARLQITERFPHSYPSSYVDKGLDASVNWPYADFKFKNNRDLPIYIRTRYTDKDVYVEIYGPKQPDDGKITLVSQVVKSTDVPAYQEIQDKDGKYVKYKDESKVVVESRAGYTVDVYEVVKDDAGNEVSKKKIYTDNYPKIVGKKYFGVKDRPAGGETGATASPAPSPSPSPTEEVHQDY